MPSLRYSGGVGGLKAVLDNHLSSIDDCSNQLNLAGEFMRIINLILAVFLPPLAAFLQVGISKHFFINIVLTLLGLLPGIIHAVWLVVTNHKG